MSLLQKTFGNEESASKWEFTAQNNSYNLGQKIVIEVGIEEEFIDFENSRLVFDAVTTTGAGAGASYNDWFASQHIRTLTVKTNGNVDIGDPVTDYRQSYQMKHSLVSSSDKNDSYLAVLEGAKSRAVPDNQTTSEEFAHKIDDHIFALEDYYPAHFHGGFKIIIETPKEISELFTASTSLPTVYKMDNVRFVARLVTMKAGAEKLMVDLMKANQLFVDYSHSYNAENQKTAGVGQNYDLVGIPGRIRSAQVFMVNDDDINGDDEGFYATWGSHNLSGYKFKLSDRALNYKLIDVSADSVTDIQTAESTIELMESLDIHARENLMGDSALTPAVLRGVRFAIGVKVARGQKNLESEITSLNSRDNNKLRVELKFSAATGVGQFYTTVQLDKRIQLLVGGKVEDVQV